MNLTLQQAADVLGKTPDEVLFIVQDKRLKAKTLHDTEIKYNEDGTIEFVDEPSEPEWQFKFEDVIELKKELEEDLDGTLKKILED